MDFDLSTCPKNICSNFRDTLCSLFDQLHSSIKQNIQYPRCTIILHQNEMVWLNKNIKNKGVFEEICNKGKL